MSRNFSYSYIKNSTVERLCSYKPKNVNILPKEK